MRMLSDYDIPYSVNDMFDGIQVSYPGDETVVCSVIEHAFSYGNQVDRLEIMGLLTKEELEHDSVKGWMTAQAVFARIYKHYKLQSLFLNCSHSSNSVSSIFPSFVTSIT